MTDGGLVRALTDGLTPRDWYLILNSKVFFWLTIPRLNTMLGAKAYRNERHLVLKCDTESLLKEHAGRIVLSPMNSGCTKPFPHSRGRSTFLIRVLRTRIERRMKTHRKNLVVELAVERSVPDIVVHTIDVHEVGGWSA